MVPFGFGLSYTSFEYTNLTLSSTTIGHCDAFTAAVTVTNTGDRDGDEVVQLYVKTPGVAIGKAPRVRLADFTRVHVQQGASVRVQLEVTPKYHSVVKDEGRESFWHPTILVEQGLLTVHVGGGQPDFTKGVLSANVTVMDTGALTTHYRCPTSDATRAENVDATHLSTTFMGQVVSADSAITLPMSNVTAPPHCEPTTQLTTATGSFSVTCTGNNAVTFRVWSRQYLNTSATAASTGITTIKLKPRPIPNFPARDWRFEGWAVQAQTGDVQGTNVAFLAHPSAYRTPSGRIFLISTANSHAGPGWTQGYWQSEDETRARALPYQLINRSHPVIAGTPFTARMLVADGRLLMTVGMDRGAKSPVSILENKVHIICIHTTFTRTFTPSSSLTPLCVLLSDLCIIFAHVIVCMCICDEVHSSLRRETTNLYSMH